ncbi:uncharacterized protein LOC134822779 [Bolinopsis microptera]|uniref:uncharacterized protein LOC134822779 n=1 Tax=Bolinopsis microptera TaxID=2820187 RepID=UPI00307B0268
MSRRVLFLFDVDGTLTAPRAVITNKMLDFMTDLSKRTTVGIVGGSDEAKIVEQLDGHIELATYLFSENGLVAKKGEKLIGKTSIIDKIGNDKLQDFINFCLSYMSKLKLPCKRGTFIEFRNGMINICPVGRACSVEERKEFFEYDHVHKLREQFVTALKNQFPDLEMKYSIGGQISFDCFPIGWDKTYCLQYIEKEFDDIYFYGDKTYESGNDYEIFIDSRVQGRTVTGPDNTLEQVTADLTRLGL